jgi:pyruvate carboxylase
MSPGEIVKAARNLPGISFTSVGMRDAGQSDYKNRLRLLDLTSLAPLYNDMGLFSAECHGGARVGQVDIDVWRCFSFLNDVRNMRAVAETVLSRGKLFSPSISFTDADWTTDEYYMGVVQEVVDLCGGTDEIIFCVKDMAGVGSVTRIARLIDSIKQKWPDLVIQYHRHMTDGLAVPAIHAAVKAGVSIVDVQEDSLVRFYGHSPMLAVQAFLQEEGIPVNLDRALAEEAVLKVREWIGDYHWAESPFKGTDHTVTEHRMPGGAFPSSFEQAHRGEFLHHMPAILKVMSLFNRIVKYFDVTPGSQITWVTCSGLVNRYAKEYGDAGVGQLINLLERFVEEHDQDLDAVSKKDKKQLLELFSQAPGDFKNLLMGNYGKLPAGWPADWVYRSTFGKSWKQVMSDRHEESPLDWLEPDNLEKLRLELAATLEREPTEEEFILYLMHPKDALDFIRFRDRYGDTPLVLPTDVWHSGLKQPGDKVEFELLGKPYCIELVSRGSEADGIIHVVVKINNRTHIYEVDTPRAVKTEIRKATGPDQVGAPMNGNIWRIGNPERGVVKVGDIIHKGEEIANLEAMKMENAILAPFNAQVAEICVNLNDGVTEGQLLFVLEPS